MHLIVVGETCAIKTLDFIDIDGKRWRSNIIVDHSLDLD